MRQRVQLCIYEGSNWGLGSTGATETHSHKQEHRVWPAGAACTRRRQGLAMSANPIGD